MRTRAAVVATGKVFRDAAAVGTQSRQKWRFFDNGKPLCLQYSNTRRPASSSRNPKRRSSLRSFLWKVRETLIQWLLSLPVRLLDFLLEPAEKLFPEEATSARRVAAVPPLRTKSVSTLALKTRSADSALRRYNAYTMQRRTVSENVL